MGLGEETDEILTALYMKEEWYTLVRKILSWEIDFISLYSGGYILLFTINSKQMVPSASRRRPKRTIKNSPETKHFLKGQPTWKAITNTSHEGTSLFKVRQMKLLVSMRKNINRLLLAVILLDPCDQRKNFYVNSCEMSCLFNPHIFYQWWKHFCFFAAHLSLIFVSCWQKEPIECSTNQHN